MDLVGVYLTAGMGVGQRLRLETIDRRIRELPIRRTLMLLAQMSFHAEKVTRVGDQEQVLALARAVFPAQIMRTAEPLLTQPSVRVLPLSSQVILNLGLRVLALAHEGEDERVRDDDLARRLGALCLALGDHIDQGPLSAETTTLEILRLGLFYSQHEHPGWLSLSARLFLDVLPALRGHPDYIDVGIEFEHHVGLDLARFWAITALQGVIAAESDEHFVFPVDPEERIGETPLNAWTRSMSIGLERARLDALAKLGQPVGWAVAALWDQPIIDYGELRGPVLRPRLLQAQAEPAQLFWHVRHALVARGFEHERWSRLYGAAVERLGLEILRDHMQTTQVFDESAMVDRWSIPAASKRADAAISSASGDLVVIDFVARQFTRSTVSTGDYKALASDLERAIVEKLEQVDSTFRHALAAGESVARLFPVVVVAGPFPPNALLDTPVLSALAQRRMHVVSIDPICRPFAVLDLVNFELMVRMSSATGTSIADLLELWLSSPLGRNSFRDWALTDGPARGKPGGGLPDDWQQRIADVLGFRSAINDRGYDGA